MDGMELDPRISAEVEAVLVFPARGRDCREEAGQRSTAEVNGGYDGERVHAAACEARALGVRSVEARYVIASGGSFICSRRAASNNMPRRHGGISGGVRIRHSLTVCCAVPLFSAVALTPPNASMML